MMLSSSLSLAVMQLITSVVQTAIAYTSKNRATNELKHNFAMLMKSVKTTILSVIENSCDTNSANQRSQAVIFHWNQIERNARKVLASKRTVLTYLDEVL